MIVRLILAGLCLMGLALGWFTNHVPTWLAVVTALALVILGLDLDWRRKEREAEERVRTRDRLRRKAKREAEKIAERLKNL